MELRGRRVLVIGAARTGLAVSQILAQRGARVRLADHRPDPPCAGSLDALGGNVETRFGDGSLAPLDDVELVVPSPGVPVTAPLLAAASARGLPIMSEIEIAARLLTCPLVAITGTNGKSTTTSLIGEMLSEADARVFVGGNLGRPLIDAVDGPWNIAVAEVSSFQLEWVERFRPSIGVWLNVSADHLDRHGSMRAYTDAKSRLFAAQTETDIAILNRDDPVVYGLRTNMRSRIVTIGLDEEGCEAGAFTRGDDIVYRERGSDTVFSLARTRLAGHHNRENMMAAVTVAGLRRVARASIQAVLDRFRGLPHRCELVREAGGVRYYDDSKATNVGALMKSLQGFPGDVVLVAGGLDKGGEFMDLRPTVVGRVRLVIAYGRAAPQIAAALGEVVPVTCLEPFADAVREARSAARPGDVVLLAPGCASFDQFADYAERGRAFCSLVGERRAT